MTVGVLTCVSFVFQVITGWVYDSVCDRVYTRISYYLRGQVRTRCWYDGGGDDVYDRTFDRESVDDCRTTSVVRTWDGTTVVTTVHG